MEARNAKHNAFGGIDMEINHPTLGWIPFTALPTDVEQHGRELYARAVDGEFGPVDPYVAPQKTIEQLISEYEAVLDNHLDSVAQQYRYNDRFTFALRAGFEGPYQAEGIAFAKWMDTCNELAFKLLNSVKNNQIELPTVEEFVAGLPEFVL